MKQIVCSVFCAAAIAAAGAKFEPAVKGTVEISGGATARVEKRIARDLPIKRDMTLVKAFTFDWRVSNPDDFASYVCYFKSGDGWYKVPLELPDDAKPGAWHHVSISTSDADQTEGKPAGWRKVDGVRIAAYRATTNAVSVTLRNVAFDVTPPQAYVVQGFAGKSGDGARYASILAKAFTREGIETRMVDECDLKPGMLDGTAFVALPFNPALKPGVAELVKEYVKGGGKLLACYSQPRVVTDLLGVEMKGSHKPSVKGTSPLAGFAKAGAGLPWQPSFAEQASWMCTVTAPRAGAKVVANWRTVDGKSTDIPGLIASPNGLYLSHVWLDARAESSRAFFEAMAERLLPGTRARNDARRERERAEEARMLAETRAIPSRAGERRLIWCHSAWGLGGTNDWDSTCRFIRQNGFTDLVVNLAWGGYVYYPSKVLPREAAERGDALEQCRAACRKYGVKMHVWKVCWKMGAAVSPEFLEAQKAAGRVQRGRDASFSDNWNCPSDPHNQQLEVDAMVELALDKKVDGIHFDYIRYPGGGCCFCDGCRKRFESRIGRSVANWPRDVDSSGPLAEEWAAFRCDNISRVVHEVHDRVRAAKSKVEISAAVFRDPVRDPYTVGQDWVRWCAEGWLDFVCPMDYVKNPKRYAKVIARQHAALRDAGSKAKFYPGMAVKCSHFNEPITPLDVAQEILAVRAEGLEGFTLFSLSRPAEYALPILRQGPLSAD